MPATETRVHEKSTRIKVKHTMVLGDMTLEDLQFDQFALLWCYFFLFMFFFIYFFLSFSFRYFVSFKNLLSLFVLN